jgi:uncharacterized membrane protein HdeD (DUF308 family)
MLLTVQHNWWALAIRGVAAIIFGLLTFFAPGITIAVLVLWFGAYALVDGIFSIIAALRTPDGRSRWGSLLVEGIVGIAAGIVTFLWPAITAAVLIFLIAGWAIVTGILEIAAAIHLRRIITGEWALIALGALSILFGLFLAIAPIAGALAIALWIGAYAILFGVLMLVLAFRMRKWMRMRPVQPAFRPA